MAELLGQMATADAPVAGRFRSLFGAAKRDYGRGDDAFASDPHADGDTDDAQDGPDARGGSDNVEVAAAHDEIAGLLSRMRALTKAARR